MSRLNRNGNNIYSFLKIQVRFTGINSLSDTLTKYIKSSKCYNQKCPIFTRTKCSKCKTAIYCSEACQNKDWKIHRQNCEVLRIDKVNRIDVFQDLITEIVASKLKSSVNFLTFKDFFDRIRPFAFRGYYDFILKETFLLGAIKFSSEKFSNIDIDEDISWDWGTLYFPCISHFPFPIFPFSHSPVPSPSRLTINVS